MGLKGYKSNIKFLIYFGKPSCFVLLHWCNKSPKIELDLLPRIMIAQKDRKIV